MTTDQDLEKLRTSIRDVDRQLLDLVSRRMELARQVGEYKRDRNLPIKDYRVEKIVLENAKKRADELGIYRNLAANIMQTLIEFSVLEQDVIKQNLKDAQTNAGRRVLVIGGAGNMGRWFASFFLSLGFDVTIADKQSSQDFRQIDITKDPLSSFDMILLATPMSQSSDLLDALCNKDLGSNTIVIEICSLKTPVEKALERAELADLNVVSIHPMFGPDIEILSGRNIVFCHRQKGQDALQEIKSIFTQTSANLIDIDFDQHDRLMSYVLGAAHLQNLIFADLIRTSGFPLNKLMSMAGTTFSKQIDVTKNVVQENQDLYFEIQSFNKETRELFGKLKSSMELFDSQIAAQNLPAFKQMMQHARQYFSETQAD